MSRRAAHCVHSVTLPAASTAASRSASGAECGRSNVSARPGSANHADSPVSQSSTDGAAAGRRRRDGERLSAAFGRIGAGGDFDEQAAHDTRRYRRERRAAGQGESRVSMCACWRSRTRVLLVLVFVLFAWFSGFVVYRLYRGQR